MITPSGAPSSAYRKVCNAQFSARYLYQEFERYIVRIPAPAPPELRMTLQLGQEGDAGVWAHIEELDVSAEGRSVDDAFRNVLAAAREWLTYVRDENPELAPELAHQARYLPLLAAPPFSWFREFRFTDE